MKVDKVKRLIYFDYFRAIAIIFIVAGHSYLLWNIDTIPEKVIANLITGGSSLFVFISGFFFHYRFYPKFNFGLFMRKKISNVFLPYLILSTLSFICLDLLLNGYNPEYFGHIDGPIDCVIKYLKFIWSGRELIAYWYIPFIMIMFFLSPIFIKFIKLSKYIQLVIFSLLLIISMLVHRPTFCLNPIHSVIYFLPLYLLGIIFSINRDKIMNSIVSNTIFLGVITILLSLLQVVTTYRYNNYFKDSIFTFAGFDVIILQKIVMIFFFLSLLSKFETKNFFVLKYIASISFSIFFIHSWVLWFFRYFSLLDYISFLPGPLIVVTSTIANIFICIIIANIFKLILGKSSRFIIG